MSDHFSHLFFPSWADVQTGSAVLSLQIQKIMLENRTDSYVLVGIGPNGLIPGVIVSNLTQLPFMAVNYRSPTAKEPFFDGLTCRDPMPTVVSQGIISGEAVQNKIPTIILIDAKVDSGNTLEEAREAYEKMDHTVYSAVLYYCTTACVKPDIFWNRIDGGDKLIPPSVKFPWET